MPLVGRSVLVRICILGRQNKNVNCHFPWGGYDLPSYSSGVQMTG